MPANQPARRGRGREGAELGVGELASVGLPSGQRGKLMALSVVVVVAEILNDDIKPLMCHGGASSAARANNCPPPPSS